MTKLVTVWDGEAFLEIPEDEALKLEAEDKCQIFKDSGWDSDLKYREQFTGYNTREMTSTKPVKKSKAKAKPKSK